jgi:glutathione S-transferase
MVTFLRQTKSVCTSEFTWIDLAIAEMVSVLNVMDKRFKDYNNQVQNYANRVFALPQFIVYRKS